MMEIHMGDDNQTLQNMHYLRQKKCDSSFWARFKRAPAARIQSVPLQWDATRLVVRAPTSALGFPFPSLNHHVAIFQKPRCALQKKSARSSQKKTTRASESQTKSIKTGSRVVALGKNRLQFNSVNCIPVAAITT